MRLCGNFNNIEWRMFKIHNYSWAETHQTTSITSNFSQKQKINWIFNAFIWWRFNAPNEIVLFYIFSLFFICKMFSEYQSCYRNAFKIWSFFCSFQSSTTFSMRCIKLKVITKQRDRIKMDKWMRQATIKIPKIPTFIAFTKENLMRILTNFNVQSIVRSVSLFSFTLTCCIVRYCNQRQSSSYESMHK